MPAESAPQQGLTIRPLTFLQVYRTVRPLRATHNGSTAPASAGNGSGAHGRTPPALQPLVYHLAMSGYGAFEGQDTLGWMFLRGSHQVLVIDSLHAAEGDAAPATTEALLTFAERQARILRRRWLGALVENGTPPGGSATLAVRGFQGQPLYVYRSDGTALPEMPATPNGSLRALSGSRGDLARARFARAAMGLEDSPDGEYLARYLLGNVVPVRHWLVIPGGDAVAYLSSGLANGRLTVELLTGRAKQASEAILTGLQQVLAHVSTVAAPRREVEVRVAGVEQSEALQAGLAALGFASQQHPARRLYKELLAV